MREQGERGILFEVDVIKSGMSDCTKAYCVIKTLAVITENWHFKFK